MARTYEALVTHTTKTLAVWPAAKRSGILSRWTTAGMGVIAADVPAPVTITDTNHDTGEVRSVRGKTKCTVCGAPDIRRRGKGRPPATCGDAACASLRAVARQVAYYVDVDWTDLLGIAKDEHAALKEG